MIEAKQVNAMADNVCRMQDEKRRAQATAHLSRDIARIEKKIIKAAKKGEFEITINDDYSYGSTLIRSALQDAGYTLTYPHLYHSVMSYICIHW